MDTFLKNNVSLNTQYERNNEKNSRTIEFGEN